MTAQQLEEERYDPRDTTLTFVNRRDDISLDDDEGILRAEMSCGHAVTPQSLSGWCRCCLEQGQYKFRCPALNEDTQQPCNQEWTYKEVRRLAALTTEDMEYFEESTARLAAASYCEIKTCPGCKTVVERKNLSNLNVCCTVCKADKKETFDFCWQCLKPWKGPAPRSDRCDNEGCVNQDLELLKNCKFTTFKSVQGVTNCPSIRACPTCGQRVEHDETGCKNVICPRCQVEFCFVCLKLTPECLKTSSYFIACSDGVAPRQTSIPVWQRR